VFLTPVLSVGKDPQREDRLFDGRRNVMQAPAQARKGPPEKAAWTRGMPGENLKANRTLLKRIGRWIKADQRTEVLAAIKAWPPADVMELLIYFLIVTAI
jgi:hypothetical protein